jgi:hypothetical protein
MRSYIAGLGIALGLSAYPLSINAEPNAGSAIIPGRSRDPVTGEWVVTGWAPGKEQEVLPGAKYPAHAIIRNIRINYDQFERDPRKKVKEFKYSVDFGNGAVTNFVHRIWEPPGEPVSFGPAVAAGSEDYKTKQPAKK